MRKTGKTLQEATRLSEGKESTPDLADAAWHLKGHKGLEEEEEEEEEDQAFRQWHG
jgi:hypothetical protein